MLMVYYSSRYRPFNPIRITITSRKMLMVCGRRKKVGRKENVNGIRAREEEK